MDDRTSDAPARCRFLGSFGRVLGLFCVLLLPTQALAEAVRITHALSFPPYAEAKDGVSEGLAVEIIRAASARAGLEIVLLPLPFDQLQRALEDGRADAVFPTADTPERRQSYDFSHPLLVTGGALYVRSPDPAPESLASLSDKIVVTPRTGPLAAVIEKTAPAVKLTVTADYEESLKMLMSGEAEAAALNVHVGARLANRLYPGKINASQKMFLEVPLAVMVRKGQHAKFLSDLNAGLAALRADGSWQRISERWTTQ